jgi:hypothetical protein
MSPEAPWEGLVALAERERDLVLEGDWEAVELASSSLLSASLALGPPPPEAAPHLERLVELQAEITAGLSVARAFTASKLSRMDHGRMAVRGYGAGFAAARPVIDGRG